MSLKKNVIANFVGQGWTALMGLAFLPLYIKYLGIEAYGLIGFYAVMQAWLVLLDLGITQTLNREMARFIAGSHTPQSIHDLLRSLEVISIGLATLICALVWVSSSYIASRWLDAQNLTSSEIKNAVMLMGLVIALRFIEGIYKGALLGLQKQVAVNVVNVLIATMRYGCVIAVLAWYVSSITVFFAWQALTSVISLVALLLLVYKTLPKPPSFPRFSSTAIKKIWRFAGGMLGITFLAVLLTQVDKLLLSKLINLKDYGYYTLAATMSGGLALITAPTTTAIYPKMVQYVAQESKQELTILYHQGAQLVSILIAPVAMMLIFCGVDIVYLWSGDMNLAKKTAPILLPLALGSFLNCLLWMPYQLQLAYGWTKFGIKVNAIAVTLLIPAIFLVTPHYGAVGAAWVWALLNTGYLIVGMHFMYKKLLPSEKWAWYWQDITKQTMFAVFVMVVVRFMMEWLLINSSLIKSAIYVFALCGALFAAVWQSNQIKPFAIKNINAFFKPQND